MERIKTAQKVVPPAVTSATERRSGHPVLREEDGTVEWSSFERGWEVEAAEASGPDQVFSSVGLAARKWAGRARAGSVRVGRSTG